MAREMQLIGLDDNISKFGGGGGRFIGGHGGFLTGLSEEAKTAEQCTKDLGGQPCFTMGADYASYPLEIFKEPLFWVMSIGGVFKKLNDSCSERDFRNGLSHAIKGMLGKGKKPYIEFADGRKIYPFADKSFNESLIGKKPDDAFQMVQQHCNNYKNSIPENKRGETDWTGICSMEYTTIALGGPYVDQYGKSIFVFSDSWGANPLAFGLLKEGYWGVTNDTGESFAKFWHRHRSYGDGGASSWGSIDWHGKLPQNPTDNARIDIAVMGFTGTCENASDFYYSLTDYYYDKNFCELIYQRAREASDKLKDRKSGIVYKILRGDNIISSDAIWGIVAAVAGVALGAIGLASLASPVQALASKAVQSGGKLNFKDLMSDPKLVNGLASGLLCEKSPVTGYINKSIDLQKAVANKDYGPMLSMVGLSSLGSGSAGMVAAALQSNDLMPLLQKSKGMKYDELAAIAQNCRNVTAPEDVQKLLQSNTLVTELLATQNAAGVDGFQKIVTANSGGGYAPMIPMKGRNEAGDGNIKHIIPLILQKDDYLGLNKIDANRHNALIRMSNGFPIDPNVFDDITIMGLEKKMQSMGGLSGGEKTLCIPAGIPVDKRECFAKYLKCRGFNVIIGSDAGIKAEKAQPTKPLVQVAKPSVKTNATVVTTKKKKKEWM